MHFLEEGDGIAHRVERREEGKNFLMTKKNNQRESKWGLLGGKRMEGASPANGA